MSQWLNAEALAQYVVGFLTGVLSFLSWWLFKKKRARYILIEEVLGLSLLSIHPEFRDRITVTLDKQVGGGKQIDQLSQLNANIYNPTSETIDDVELRFFFQLPLESLLSVQLDPLGELQRLGGSPPFQLDLENQILVITLPYLRSFKLYKQVIILTVVADGYPRVTKVEGGGRDWEAQYLSYEERRKQELRKGRSRAIRNVIAVLIAVIAFALTFHFYLRQVVSLRSPEWNLRFGVIIGSIFGFLLAGLIGSAASLILFFWKRRTAIRRSLSSFE